ncbi:MAG TPA: Asp-tRNA(Asn)/Glu-tRNA(Gln) amidotransferase subunit GatB [Candidatus Dormibacteraeota bacterium]|nr:Asp-tRNA(Asn)/Glu-tRNA(Gln) amidotransferase subunit GatB [Candidatus Dormibacteraeota bacterium]
MHPGKEGRAISTQVKTDWEAVIGMEVHVQLATRSKMFCGCGTDYLGRPPNSNVCPVCLGLPGTLPVINRRAVELLLKSALALNCEIQPFTKFDRKNYFYPDLPKGYQISQYDLPMSRNGWIDIGGKRVRITRVHLEEDTGKLVHSGDSLHSGGESMVDLNRSGMPLMEIVTEPDLRSATDARDYAMELRALLRTIGASEADMEKGHLRAEANVSIRPRGSSQLGVKTELKNINSFRALHRAVEFELKRQGQLLESGGTVVQETRGWSEAEQRTISQRSKEFAEDYRYFPEPDLPPLTFEPAYIEELRNSLPELPAARRTRLAERAGLSEYDARLLTGELEVADFFERLLDLGAEPKPAANWVIGEVLPVFDGRLPDAADFAALVKGVQAGDFNRDQGRQIVTRLMEGAAFAEASAGMAQLSDAGELAAIVDRIISENPQAVADFRAGKQAAIGALIGKVKQASSGTANLKLATELLRDRLSR